MIQKNLFEEIIKSTNKCKPLKIFNKNYYTYSVDFQPKAIVNNITI